MLRYPCRCKKCRSRKTLAKHPDLYLQRRFVVCSCGGEFVVDNYRRKKEHRLVICNCNWLHYPHRKGGSVWCVNHLNGPSEADQLKRYGDA